MFVTLGKKLSKPGPFDERSFPVKFDLKGSYGVAINWSDGFSADIFPFDTLRLIAEEVAS